MLQERGFGINQRSGTFQEFDSESNIDILIRHERGITEMARGLDWYTGACSEFTDCQAMKGEPPQGRNISVHPTHRQKVAQRGGKSKD